MSTIGDRFFDIRARLGTATFALSKLAREVDLPQERIDLLQGLMGNLREPFLFVVAGEVNAGKSTLLNALFGEEFCETNALPMTAQICLFKYGPEKKDLEISDTLREMYRPSDFLKDFNIVDTPGTNSIMENHQEITERYIPMADLVIFTFSVTNPWGGTAWALLDRIHKNWFKNIIFVLQQCDLRSSEEISAIVDHIRLTSNQRLGTQFPTFAVSAKQAFLSKTSGLDKERLWEQSGFEGLERYINEMVESPVVREQKLGNICHSAQLILGEVRNQLATATRILQADEQLLSGLGHHVEAQRQRTLDKFDSFFRTLDSAFMELSYAGTNVVRRNLGPFATIARLFSGDTTPNEIERKIQDGMYDAARSHVSNAIKIVEDDIQHLWRYMQDKMRDHYNFELKVNTSTGVPDWSEQRQHMSARLKATLDRKLPTLGLTAFLNHRTKARSWSIAMFHIVALLCAGGGIAAYYLELIPADKLLIFGGIIAGVILAAFICAGVYAQQSMNTILKDLGEHFDDHRAQLARSVQASMGEEVGGFFTDFLRLFAPLHQLCDENRRKYQPQIQDLDDLEKGFAEIHKLISGDEAEGAEAPNSREEVPL